MQKNKFIRYTSMTVVNQNNATQTFITIPKGYIEGEPLTLKLKDEQTKEVFTFTNAGISKGLFCLFTFVQSSA